MTMILKEMRGLMDFSGPSIFFCFLNFNGPKIMDFSVRKNKLVDFSGPKFSVFWVHQSPLGCAKCDKKSLWTLVDP